MNAQPIEDHFDVRERLQRLVNRAYNAGIEKGKAIAYEESDQQAPSGSDPLLSLLTGLAMGVALTIAICVLTLG